MDRVQRVFLTGFWSTEQQNVGLHADFLGKSLIIERRFFQNVTVFMGGASCFLDVFLSKKRTKGEISDVFQRKPLIIERQFSQNVTIFYARDSVFF